MPKFIFIVKCCNKDFTSSYVHIYLYCVYFLHIMPIRETLEDKMAKFLIHVCLNVYVICYIDSISFPYETKYQTIRSRILNILFRNGIN